MPTENSVITREHLPGLLLARTIWENGGPSLYFPPALQDATDQARAALPAPVSVPEGYVLVPVEPSVELLTAMSLSLGMHPLGDGADGSYPITGAQSTVMQCYRAILAAAPTVKAEPIMEVCPECGGEEATSLPAAGLTDLTAVHCQCCATEYPHDSYDAGFIAGSGMCQVCDAAIPAVDLPSAAPAEQPYPHGIAEDLERSDWAPLEALQWYAAGKHFDVADGRTRIIDTGAVASNALKHASLAYLELKGDAELSELRAALSAHQSDPWAPSGADYDRAIHHNPDAKAWADLFIATFPGQADKHDLMLGWFANAMMAMYDHLKAQQSAHVSVPGEWLDAVKELFDAKQAKEDFERENPGNSTKRWDACLYRIEAAEDALRALLNGGEA